MRLLVSGSVAEEGAEEVIVPVFVIAAAGHLTFRLGAGGGFCGILRLFIQKDVQRHFPAATQHGDGGGVAGLELPQGPGQVGDVADPVAAQVDDDVLGLQTGTVCGTALTTSSIRAPVGRPYMAADSASVFITVTPM